MMRLCAFSLALLAAGPATALSCLQPSIESTFRFAVESPLNYMVAVGSLRAVGASVPPGGVSAVGGDINNMAGYTQLAQFEGQFFTGTDFSLDRSVPVTVEVTCISAWCGSFEDVESGMFFLQQAPDDSFLLEAGPCGGTVFLDPDEHSLFLVQDCYNNNC